MDTVNPFKATDTLKKDKKNLEWLIFAFRAKHTYLVGMLILQRDFLGGFIYVLIS